MTVARDAVGWRAHLGPSRVKDRLSLQDCHDDWLSELAATAPPRSPLVLPERSHVAGLLTRLECRPADAAAVATTLPSPDREPELWWLLERCCQRLVADMGGIDYLPCRWPSLPAPLGARGRLFYAHVFLARVRAVRRWHQSRGVPRDVSRVTLADLGRSLELHRAEHGKAGLDRQDWLTLHFRGALYQLGRLQFHRSHLVPGLVGAGPLFWHDRETAEAMGPGFRLGDPVLGVHVPATGPLAPGPCDDSFGQAPEFFARTFPAEKYRLAVCTSWLLDDQLAAYLPETSNIVRFQRRFQLIQGARNDDEGVLRSVFGQRPASLDYLSPRTALELGVVAHLRAGGHWHIRTGWLHL
jgi:hypothetical protein